MSGMSVIAVFDIGRTNKKFFLLDTGYKIVFQAAVRIAEIKDDDGEPCENLQALSKWMRAQFLQALRHPAVDVRALQFCAYGASLVYVDTHGRVIAPLYSYLKPYPPELADGIYRKYGGRERLSRQTASPSLGSLNAGLQLFRLKAEKPQLFRKVRYALHLPQYLGYLFSGRQVSDITSIGCHTLLWNFRENSYHAWVRGEGLSSRLAPLRASTGTTLARIGKKDLKIGVGLHDSSAALIPYLEVFHEPFVLLSTGTWCISLNPFNKTRLTSDELKQDCLCYLDYRGRLVKASRLFAGDHHEKQTRNLAQLFGKPTAYYKKIPFQRDLIRQLSHPEKVPGTPGLTTPPAVQVFENREWKRFGSYEEAYHVLVYDIVRLQSRSTRLVLGNGRVKRIFVDGGFSSNVIFMHLLANAFDDLEVYAASVPQATAIGAALAIHHSWNPQPVPADLIRLTHYRSVAI